jgi:hypothetical protein
MCLIVPPVADQHACRHAPGYIAPTNSPKLPDSRTHIQDPQARAIAYILGRNVALKCVPGYWKRAQRHRNN